MKDWYLMTPHTRPNMTGGYENEGFRDWKDDAFYETLDSDIAVSVVLYNHDLSVSSNIRCIIQGNTGDTQLKTMERSVLTPIGTLHSGDYIYFENEYWIIDGRPGNNGIYEKSTLKECQYKLRWQKSDGTIVERWANLTSASKYDVGQKFTNTFVLTSNNYTILIPNDADSMTIENQRVFIDKSDNPTKVFKITRNDDVLFDYGIHGGILNLIADKTEFKTETDNASLRICDYVDSVDDNDNVVETPILTANIIGSNSLKIGFPQTYTVRFYNEKGEETDWNELTFNWNITDIDNEMIERTEDKNTIKLKVSEESLAGNSFSLSVNIGNVILNTINVDITEAI